ncbi:MAG: DMT family transporter, partial [Bdellovibrionales bacterium]
RRQPLFQASPEQVRLSVFSGFLQFVAVACLMAALSMMSGPLVIITLFLFPLLLFFYLIAKGEARFSGAILALSLSALVGLGLVLNIFDPATQISFWGVGLSLVAAVASAMRMYFYERQIKKRGALLVGAENFVVASVCSLILLLWQAPHLPETLVGYGWMLGVTIGVVFGSAGMFFGLRFVDSFSWSLMAKMEPIFVAIYSAVLLKEILSVSQYLGIALVLVSLVAYQWFSSRKKLL